MAKQCEICGLDVHWPPSAIEIDGATLQVCAKCAALGRRVTIQTMRGAQVQPIPTRPVLSSKELYSDYELDPDYGSLVRQARQNMGLTHEELGRLIDVKPSVISLIERNKLKPEATLLGKLRHQLKVNLLVPSIGLNPDQT